MAESFSLKAILSAADKGFTSTMKAASGYVDNLKSTLTSGVGFGVMMAAGQAAFNTISNGVTGLVGDLNSSSAAWKTFQGNMEMTGNSADEIKSVKNELQDFAEATIYSSSDMASTFAQLEAVGTKNTTKLVKGFGGLAAAAESPTQAMKTLSQQATQMAAKPTVAWEDFKLMLEQTPAGIAAVAKQMGKSTQGLIKDVQAGTVATEDFFDAIAAVGTNDAFTKLATEYKTVGQAMDGLQETAANKLQPAFDVLSSKGISAISKLVDKMGELDGEKIAAKLTSGLDKIKPYWDVLVTTASEVGSAFGDAFSAISKELADLNGSFGSTESVEGFGDAIGVAGDALKAFAGFLEDNADTVALLIDNLPKLLMAYMAFKTVKAVAPGVTSFGKAIIGLASNGISGLATKLFGVSDATKTVGNASATSGKMLMQSAVSFLAFGAGIALAAGGLYIMAQAAIQLANAGPGAVAVMAGMVAVMALLAVGASKIGTQLTAASVGMVAFGAAVLIAGAGMYVLSAAAINLVNAGTPAIAVMAGMVVSLAGLMALAAVLGPALTAGAVGFIAFGTAIALVSTGALLASAALAVVAAVLPTVSEYGLQGAVAIASLAVGLAAFAAGAAVAGAGSVALGAGLVVVAAGFVATGAAVLVTSAGMAVLAVSLKAVNSSMKSIATNAKSAQKSLTSMEQSVDIVSEGLDALGSKAKSAINSLIDQFRNAEGKAKSSGKAVGDNFNNGVSAGMRQAVTTANAMSNSVVSAMRSGQSGAYSSGVYIGQGLANGMSSMLGTVRAVAAQLAAAANAAIEAKAKIGSPSKVTTKLGGWFGQGWVNGIRSKVKAAKNAAIDLISIPRVPDIRTPSLAGYNMTLDESYSYNRGGTYTIYVPVEIEGREVAKASAVYTQAELEKLDKMNKRKGGVR